MNARLSHLLQVKTDLAKLSAEMYATGVLVDHAQRKELSRRLKALSGARRGAVTKAVKDRAFDATPDAFRALIFERHKRKNLRCFNLPDPPLGSRGKHEGWTDETETKCAVNKPSLLRLLIHPTTPDELKVIIERWWRFHAPRKARATYVDSKKVEEAIGNDGRLRPSWNSCGTETMRFSCSAPNLMNLSEKKEAGDLKGDLPDVRSMYVAPRGFVIVGADWSQQELRMMQAVSGDPALAKALATGDVYSYDARDWYGLPADFDVKKNKPAARKSCKIGHLACQYAAGMNAVYQQALIQDRTTSYQHIKHIYEKFRRTYAATVAYWSSEHLRVRSCGYSEGRILANRRYYPEEPPPTETANFPVQDSCGEMASLAMIALDRGFKRYLPRANVVINLHDAFYSYVPDDSASIARAVELYRGAMVGPWRVEGRQIDFPIDIKVGRRWTEDKRFEDCMQEYK